eukprot:3330320-Pleurochrysis_carterae.AAC.2
MSASDLSASVARSVAATARTCGSALTEAPPSTAGIRKWNPSSSTARQTASHAARSASRSSGEECLPWGASSAST